MSTHVSQTYQGAGRVHLQTAIEVKEELVTAN